MSRLSQIPDMTYDSLEAEYTLNEYWNYEMERVDMENLDIQDKKNVLLCGRSFMKLNFLDGCIRTLNQRHGEVGDRIRRAGVVRRGCIDDMKRQNSGGVALLDLRVGRAFREDLQDRNDVE